MKVDTSLASVNVPAEYDPFTGGVFPTYDYAPSTPFVKCNLSVSVQGDIPYVRYVDPKPDEVFARVVIEETFKMYNKRARPLPDMVQSASTTSV
jgi:hypothetical protein